MSSNEERVVEAADAFTERTIMLVLTLIVTTVIAVFAVYVLGSAVLDAGGTQPTHRAALAAMHVQS